MTLFFFYGYQWEALALLLIGISVNQLSSIPDGTKSFGLAVTTIAYIYTLIFVSFTHLHGILICVVFTIFSAT